MPGHPAIAASRGRALAQVWRWEEAAPHFEAAALGAPLDDTLWAALAVARGSAGDASGALEAARRGLALTPRQPDLLRSQAIALHRLDPGSTSALAADEQHLAHRIADVAPELRSRCSAHVPGCARERKPVHVHELSAHW